MIKASKKTTTNTYASVGLLILRLFFGGLMLTHGYPKLMKLIEGNLQFRDPIGIGEGFSLVLTVFAEFLCSIFIILGLYTRLSAIPLIVTMLVAAFIVHGSDPIGTQEKALLYLGAYLTLFFAGAGKYSLDKN